MNPKDFDFSDGTFFQPIQESVAETMYALYCNKLAEQAAKAHAHPLDLPPPTPRCPIPQSHLSKAAQARWN